MSFADLPPDVLRLVLDALVAGYEPDGVVGARAVARDLAAASEACSDLRRAVRDGGLPALSARLPRIPSSSIDWDAVVRDPGAQTLSKLRKAARALGRRMRGSRATLTARVLLALGASSSKYNSAPANVLRAVYGERRRLNVRGRVHVLLSEMARAGDRASRDLLRGKRSTAALQDAAAAVYPTIGCLVAANATRMVRCDRVVLFPTCRCGKPAALRCIQGMCGVCCEALGCRRHWWVNVV
jgi:hypothetical protein